MDGNISKALWLGVSILLFVAVVTIGLSIFGTMKDTSAAANENINSIAQSLAEEDFRAFDGKEVKGDQVLSAINNLSGRSGDVIVLVATLGSNSGQSVNLDPPKKTGLNLGSYAQYVSETSNNALLSADDNGCVILSSKSDQLLNTISKTARDAKRRDAENSNLPGKYINPAGRFRSYLVYDENQVIRGIICAQVE
ncbi:MAG TPA: hypothetical protein PK369_07800 [Thermoclostridium sp.]|nr:hypothetical protein [Thermoclostridium sp.]HPU44912.1 hypothetical protein [Thermoclostridium sp.]